MQRATTSPWSHYRQAFSATRHLVLPHLISVAVVAGLAASPPLLVGLLVDHVITTGAPQDWLWPAVAALVGIGVVFLATSFLRDYLATVIGETTGCAFQCALYDHLQRLSADFYQLSRVGEITARLTTDVNQGVRPLYMHLVSGLSGAVMLLTACACLAWYAPLLFLLFLALGTINIGLSSWALPRLHKRFRALQDDHGALNAQITEAVTVHSLVRAFAREDEARRRLDPLIDRYAAQQVRAQRFLWRFLVFIWAFEIVLCPFLILIVGAVLIQDGTPAGSLVAAVLWWRSAAEFKWDLTQGITGMMSGWGSLQRAVAFFTETPLVADPADAEDLPPGPGRLQFEQIRFAYPQARDGYELGPVDLSVPAGSRCALLGVSGSGKSTIAQLLCRIYDPDEGRITIDGHDIRTRTQRSLRQRIGFMTQDTQLFDGSLRDNLAFADPQAEDATMISALRQADLGLLIDDLPEGLDTRIGERGIRLSGGQRQRLAIARLLLLDPAIVLLDEATSALDAVTEESIWQTIDELFADRTQLVITHRIATALKADHLAVLAGGRLAGTGTATQLAQECEAFRELCAAQHVEVEETQ